MNSDILKTATRSAFLDIYSKRVESLVSFVPKLTEHGAGIIRFTRRGVRSRNALVVAIDNCAAHNIIDASLIADASSPARTGAGACRAIASKAS